MLLNQRAGVPGGPNIWYDLGNMSWASRRKIIYVSIIALFVALAAGIPAFFYFYRAPTCSDGVKNGKEEGVDCGGSCLMLCAPNMVEPVVLWVKPFKVSDGIYNVVAYAENMNAGASVDKIPYRFRLFDSKGLLVSERVASVSIPPRRAFAIFESGISTGYRVPVRATFSFESEPAWKRTNGGIPELLAESKGFEDENSSPRLLANIKNPTLSDVSDVEVVAIVYDRQGNALGASRTYLDHLQARSAADVYFTWPFPFTSKAVRVELLVTSNSLVRQVR